MTIRFNGIPNGYAIGAFVSGTGNIRPGTKLRFYNTGGTTPRAIYSDTGLTTPITQPIVADSAGIFRTDGNGNAVNDIFLQSGLYKLRWETSAGVEILTWDNVDPGLATGGSGGILAVADGGTGASTAGGALAALGAASQTGLDTEISDRQALDARVVVLETASAFINPGGRLTISTGNPVLSSDVTAAGTIYYAPYVHNRIPLWNGTQWSLHQFSELSQALSDATKSPVAGTTNAVYDMFVWSDSGTIRCTRGPAWSTATSRGTGAGTSELIRVDGFWMNAQNVNNGPTAQRGLYVGTIATDGSTQCNMMFAPTPAAGGTANRLDVWNAYNKVDVSSVSRDSTDSWTYTTATVRAANNNNNNRVTFVRGLNEDAIDAIYYAVGQSSTTGQAIAGVGLDATDAFSGIPGAIHFTGAGPNTWNGAYKGLPGLGRHFVQACEYSVATGTTTWFGDNGAATLYQMALMLETRM